MKIHVQHKDIADALQFNVQVNIECYNSSKNIAASVISSDKNKIDDQVLADYLAFIDEAILEIEDHDLIVLEQSKSGSSQTSRYFTLADLDQNVCGTMKFVIFLRISNHVRTDNDEVLKWIREKRNNTAEKFKVKWKVREIIVNDSRFDDYDSAVEYVGECAEKYKQSLNKHHSNT